MRASAVQLSSDPLVAQLVRAGVSLPTALAMQRHKAIEILELLRADVVREPMTGGRARDRI